MFAGGAGAGGGVAGNGGNSYNNNNYVGGVGRMHSRRPPGNGAEPIVCWSRVAMAPDSRIPPPRSGAASVVVKGKLYVFGGYGGGTGRLDDFWSYDFESATWEEVPVLSSVKPHCRENNGVFISDSIRLIYLFGGYNGTAWLNDLWEFDIETKRWTCIQESSDLEGNSRGNNDVANAAGLQLQVAGNENAGGSSVVMGKIPSRRFGYVSVVHDSKFVLFGGFDGTRWLNDMYVFDFSSRRWTEIPARGSLPSARSCPAWAKDDTHVYIQGGYDGVERKADFFALDLSTYTWSQMPCLGNPPSPRYFHSCCLYGNRMYLYGGYSGNERLADMYAYDFDTNHWSLIDCSRSSAEAPSGRSSLVAQVHLNYIYVFGGYNGTTVLNDFFRFRLKPIGVPPPALVNDFQRLINNPDFADVCFLVEGKLVYANRAVLAIRSDYFRVMLCGGMRESVMMTDVNQPADDHNTHDNSSVVPFHTPTNTGAGHPIPLFDISYSVFLKVLEFLYTDSVGAVTPEVGIHLLIASEQFMLDRLKALCEDLIRRDISTETVVSILVASHRHHATGLKDIALEYILNNLSDPVVMSGLSELKTEPDLLLEIIRRNTYAAASNVTYNAESSANNHNNHNNVPMNVNDATNNVVAPFGVNDNWNARR